MFTDESLNTLLERCSEFEEIDSQHIVDTVHASLKAKQATGDLLALQDKWYASIANEPHRIEPDGPSRFLPNPDYSVYGDPLYIAEAWCCWWVYSRKYLKNIQKGNSFTIQRSVLSILGNVKTLLDLGCGFGHTTAAWKELMPNANVIGTNVPDTLQMSVAEKIGAERGFTMMNEPPETKVDVVFASEYFEHIENPIDHLRMLVDRTNPEVLLVANAFGQQAIGHFNDYQVGHKRYLDKHMNRVFAFAMNKLGYVRVNTRLWNQRPALWARAEG